MRETKFIAKHQQKWELFEYYIKNNESDPEKLNEMYIQISDDLSYARTFYPNRSVRVFLNQLALKISTSLFKTKHSPWKRFKFFWSTELPQLVWESRWEFILALGVFLLAAFIGALSTAIDPEFPRIILGDSYVDSTIENIKKGDPMAVYKGGWAVTDALGITANNIFVSFLTFFLGILGSIGTILMLLRNGIMLGAFQYFFIQKGVFWQSFLAIWLHGTLEISSIVIAGAAGITLGKGLLFPGSYRRIQAFQRSARKGFKIMLGIIPILMIAGTVEGFLTRYTDAPTLLRLGFIILSLGFILFYFVWLPYQSYLSGKEILLIDRPLAPDPQTSIEWYKIRSVSVIFSDTFFLFSTFFSGILRWAFIVTIVYTLLNYLFCSGEITAHFIFKSSIDNNFAEIIFFILKFPNKINDFVTILTVSQLPLLAIVHVISLVYMGIYIYSSIIEHKISTQLLIIKAISLSIPILIFQGLLLFELTYINIILLISLPFWMLWAWNAISTEVFNPLSNFSKTFSSAKSHTTLSFFSTMFLLIAGGTIYALINILDTFVWEFIQLHLTIDINAVREIETLFKCAIGFFCLLLTFSILLIGASLTYYTLLEIGSAESLINKIQKINLQRQIRGLARE